MMKDGDHDYYVISTALDLSREHGLSTQLSLLGSLRHLSTRARFQHGQLGTGAFLVVVFSSGVPFSGNDLLVASSRSFPNDDGGW